MGLTKNDPNFDSNFDFNNDGILNPEDIFIWSDQESSSGWIPLDPDSTFIAIPITIRTIRVDFDGDGVVDFDDYFIFFDHFGTTLQNPLYKIDFDLNGDGKINFSDFFIFAEPPSR